MLTEAEITELLRSNERHRPMLNDERERILRVLEQRSDTNAGLRLDGPVAEVGHAEQPVIVDVSATPTGKDAINRNRNQRRVAWIAAALALVIAGFGLALRGTQTDGSVDTVATQPTIAVEAATIPTALATTVGQAFCNGPFADLVAGLDAWRGVDGWSRLTDDRAPEPHLPTLTASALRALAPLVDSQSLTARADLMNSSLANLDGTASVVRDARAVAVQNAVELIATEIDREQASGANHFLSCAVDELRAAAS